MKASLLLLGLAVACVSAQQDPALKITFGVTVPFFKTAGTDFFISVPKTKTEAVESGWVVTQRPDGPLDALVLYCQADDLTICIYIDDGTDRAAGVNIAIPKNELTDIYFDLETQGWTEWVPPTDDGEPITYVVQKLFFQSEEFLAQSTEDRIANYNSSTIVQENGLWYTGFNGALDRVPAIQTEIDTNSDFTKQACLIFMGRHYYYKMTSTTECTDNSIYPWFPLVHSGRIIGSGLMLVAKRSTANKWFESPGKAAVQIIVNEGPECLYNLADTPGVITCHIYFINQPGRLGCLEN